MGDIGDTWTDWNDEQKRLRKKYGIECPECKRLQPKRNPTILLPRQRCKVDGYRDPRPFEAIPEDDRTWKRVVP